MDHLSPLIEDIILNRQSLTTPHTHGTVEEKLLWCFKLYDTDNSGVIDKQEMGIIMEVGVTSVIIVTRCVLPVRVQHAGRGQRQAQG